MERKWKCRENLNIRWIVFALAVILGIVMLSETAIAGEEQFDDKGTATVNSIGMEASETVSESDEIEQYQSAKSTTIQLHAWISDTKMGSVPTNYYTGTTYYLCYELIDTETNKRLSIDHSNLNYNVKEEMTGPDGSIAAESTYANSDNNSISLSIEISGKYKGTVTVSGDINVSTSVEWTVQARVKKIQLTTWVSKSKMGEEVSEPIQGEYYYECYKLTDAATGLPINDFSAKDYTLDVEVYNPDGTLECSSTFKNDDANSVYFRALYAGTYTVKYTIEGTVGGGNFTGPRYVTMTVKENPFTLTAEKTKVTLITGQTDSQIVKIGLQGFHNGEIKFSAEGSNSNVTVIMGAQSDAQSIPVTINAVSPGTAVVTVTAMDAANSTPLASCSIDVTVIQGKYAINYNANGGESAPAGQIKEYRKTLVLSNIQPVRFGYTFLGWSTLPAEEKAEYLPGAKFNADADTTLYAVWSGAEIIHTTLPETKNVAIIMNGTRRYFKFTPDKTGMYTFESAGNMDSYVTIYDESGNRLASDDDSGDRRNFMMSYKMMADTTYYILCQAYGGNANGNYQMTVSREKEIVQRLGKTELVSTKDGGKGSIIVSWKAAEGAEGYRIFKKFAGGNWQKLTDVTADKLSYEDTSGVTGKAYTYTVRAFKIADGQEVLGEYDRTGLTATKLPARVTLKSAKEDGQGGICVSWNKLSTATGYRIFRKEPGSSWRGITNVTANTVTSYIDKDILSGKNYIYTVRAYKVYEGKTIFGSFDPKGVSAYCHK